MWESPLALTVLPGAFAVCRLPPDAVLPSPEGAAFLAVVRTADELSLVCAEDQVPDGARANLGWRCLRVAGSFTLDGTVGVLAALTGALEMNPARRSSVRLHPRVLRFLYRRQV